MKTRSILTMFVLTAQITLFIGCAPAPETIVATSSMEVTESPIETTAQPTSTETTFQGKFITYANSDLELIPGQYLVVFDSTQVDGSSVADLAKALVDGTKGTVSYLFTQTLRGFAVTNLTDAWASAISERSDVSFVRKDFLIYGKEIRVDPLIQCPGI